MIEQFVKYTSAGALGTLAHYGVLVLLVEFEVMPAALAAAAGFGIGAVINYILSYYLVFRSVKPHRETIVKFLFLAGMGAILSGYVVHAVALINPGYYLFGQLAATGIFLVANFLLNRKYTF